MDCNQPKFLRTDNDVIINKYAILWVIKMDECLNVCMRSNGCYNVPTDTHRICKNMNSASYEELNRHFAQK